MQTYRFIIFFLISAVWAVVHQQPALASHPWSSVCEAVLAGRDPFKPLFPDGYIVISSGYSSGADIAPALNAMGFHNIIHVQPSESVPPVLFQSFDPKQYVENIVFDGDLGNLVRALAGKNIIGVISGTETGVTLTSALSHALGLPGNDLALTPAHRDKFLMHKRLKEVGVRSMFDILTSDLSAIQAWVNDPNGNNGRWPVVLKPVDGAGTEGVYICSNPQEVEHAYRALMGTVNVLGSEVRQVLAQEYLAGTEFVVNTVSRNGRHVVGEIWKYHKRSAPRPGGGASNIYLYDELMDFEGPEAQALIPYAEQVLNALGVRMGPAHLEIMMTARGPVLIEMGARMMGGHTHVATRTAIGTSPLDLSIQALLSPEHFDSIQARGPLTRRFLVRNIQLISNVSGRITGVNHLERIRGLKTYWMSNVAGVGDQVQQTVDLITSPGNVWLIGSSEEQLESDYQTVRSLEASLFDVTP